MVRVESETEIEKDKKRWMDDLARQAAYNSGKMNNLTKIMIGKKVKGNSIPVRNMDGKLFVKRR